MPNDDLVKRLLAAPDAADSDAIRAARNYLDGGDVPANLPADVAEALVLALVQRGDGERLGPLGNAKDKALAKHARRGVHLLRTRGLKAEVPPPVPKQFVSHEPREPVASLVSAPVRDGEMLVWFVHEETPDSAHLDLFQASVAEAEGLRTFEVYRSTRRQWRNLEQTIEREAQLPVAQVPASYARWLLEEAYRRALDLGRTPARSYAEIRQTLPELVAPAEHPAHGAIPAEAVAAQREAGRPQRVIDVAETRTWIPDEDTSIKAITELREVVESPLVLDDRQRKERVSEVLDRFAAEAMRGPWRSRLVRRLLDLAYFLAQRAAQGSVEDGRDLVAEGALCLYAAESVTRDEDSPVGRAIFGRLAPPPRRETIEAEAHVEEERAGGLILPP